MIRQSGSGGRRTPRSRLLLLVWLATASACEKIPPSGPPSPREQQVIQENVQTYFRRAVSVGANVRMTVADFLATPTGLLTASLELSNGTQTQKIPIVVTRDGRYLVQGVLTDLTQDPFKATMEKMALATAPQRGPTHAPVTVVEFSDFECPFCARAHATLQDEVLAKYGTSVRRIYKHFPLSSHPWAEAAALSAACAQDQRPEAFWLLHDYFFANQREITVSNLRDKSLAALADTDIDEAAFAACVDEKQTLGRVQADMQEGTALGVRSTPTFFVNGRKLEGALPAAQFEAAVTEALAAVPTS